MPQPELQRALKLLRTVEGGFVNDPRDNGGATNHGLSIREVRRLDSVGGLSAFLKAKLDVDSDGDLDIDDVKGWTWDTAAEYYDQEYWSKLGLSRFPFPVALVIFDSAVNEGPGTAIRHFQRARKLSIDGVIGPGVINAAKVAAMTDDSLEAFLVEFAGSRLNRYRTLEDANVFFLGWSKRVVLVSLDAMKEASS